LLANIRCGQQINPRSRTVQQVSGLPPLDPDVNAKLPMPLISWLSKIPDDERLKFGFVQGSLAHLSQPEITAGRWELHMSQMHPDYRKYFYYATPHLPEPADIMAVFKEFDHFNLQRRGRRFFVRDTDVDGNNRLYQPFTILEYPDDHNQKPHINPFRPWDYEGVGKNSTWNQYGEAVPTVGGAANGRASAWRRIMYV
jgi:hypothetical protein